MGLKTNDNHLVFRWHNPDCKILFSITRKGESASCHFASDKAGLRHLKQAINEFCEYVFNSLKWCKMILAQTKRESVNRLIAKVGFSYLFTVQDLDIYERKRWAE